MGRLGLAGFLTAFTGTYLIAATGYFGFLAPVLARQSPAVLAAMNLYSPVLVIGALAAICFMVGYAIFGIAMTKTITLPRMSGVLVPLAARPTCLASAFRSWFQRLRGWSLSLEPSVLARGWRGLAISSGVNRQLQTSDRSTRGYKRRALRTILLTDQASRRSGTA